MYVDNYKLDMRIYEKSMGYYSETKRHYVNSCYCTATSGSMVINCDVSSSIACLIYSRSLCHLDKASLFLLTCLAMDFPYFDKAMV